jgi:hypothetical protein
MSKVGIQLRGTGAVRTGLRGGGIAQRGTGQALKRGGKARNTRRMNRLEELGRVDAEKAYRKKGKRNLKAEKRRIVKELKK